MSIFGALAGGRLHGPGGGSGRQEAGVDQSRETCSQLHDGLPHLQEGKELYKPQCGFILHDDVNKMHPEAKDILHKLVASKSSFCFCCIFTP